MSTAPFHGASGEHESDPRMHRPLTGLLGTLMRDVGGLIRAEIALARAELTQKAGQAAGGAGMAAAGGAILFLGGIFLLAAATLALMRVMEPWQAALVVGGATAFVGLVVLLIGRARLRTGSLQPQRTINSLRENKRWAESQFTR